MTRWWWWQGGDDKVVMTRWWWWQGYDDKVMMMTRWWWWQGDDDKVMMMTRWWWQGYMRGQVRATLSTADVWDTGWRLIFRRLGKKNFKFSHSRWKPIEKFPTAEEIKQSCTVCLLSAPTSLNSICCQFLLCKAKSDKCLSYNIVGRSADVLSGRHFVRTALDVLSGRRFVRTS